MGFEGPRSHAERVLSIAKTMLVPAFCRTALAPYSHLVDAAAQRFSDRFAYVVVVVENMSGYRDRVAVQCESFISERMRMYTQNLQRAHVVSDADVQVNLPAGHHPVEQPAPNRGHHIGNVTVKDIEPIHAWASVFGSSRTIAAPRTPNGRVKVGRWRW